MPSEVYDGVSKGQVPRKLQSVLPVSRPRHSAIRRMVWLSIAVLFPVFTIGHGPKIFDLNEHVASDSLSFCQDHSTLPYPRPVPVISPFAALRFSPSVLPRSPHHSLIRSILSITVFPIFTAPRSRPTYKRLKLGGFSPSIAMEFPFTDSNAETPLNSESFDYSQFVNFEGLQQPSQQSKSLVIFAPLRAF